MAWAIAGSGGIGRIGAPMACRSRRAASGEEARDCALAVRTAKASRTQAEKRKAIMTIEYASEQESGARPLTRGAILFKTSEGAAESERKAPIAEVARSEGRRVRKGWRSRRSPY